MIRHFLSAQFLRFLAVGGVAAFLHWLARIALSHWLSFSWAVALAYGVGMVIAFTLNRMFVFPLSARPAQQQLRDFALVNIAFFPVVWASSLAVEAGLRYLGMVQHTQELAHAMALAVPMLATFIMYKFVAFKEVDHGQS